MRELARPKKNPPLELEVDAEVVRILMWLCIVYEHGSRCHSSREEGRVRSKGEAAMDGAEVRGLSRWCRIAGPEMETALVSSCYVLHVT